MIKVLMVVVSSNKNPSRLKAIIVPGVVQKQRRKSVEIHYLSSYVRYYQKIFCTCPRVLRATCEYFLSSSLLVSCLNHHDDATYYRLCHSINPFAMNYTTQ